MKLIFVFIVTLCLLQSEEFTRNVALNIVIISSKNIQWQDDENAAKIVKNWDDAIKYCENLKMAAHSDWRLPTFNELYYIAARDNRKPAINSAFKNTAPYGSYWSSTTDEDNPDFAWFVNFVYGDDGYAGYKTFARHVRCVR